MAGMLPPFIIIVFSFTIGQDILSICHLTPIIKELVFPLWQAEVNYLGELLHPNLVKLTGYCIEDDQRLLVYEFMPRGSLENHLFRSMYFS